MTVFLDEFTGDPTDWISEAREWENPSPVTKRMLMENIEHRRARESR